MIKLQKSIQLTLSIGLIVSAIACGETTVNNGEEATNTSETTVVETSETTVAEALSPGEQANAEFEDKLSGQALLDALQTGGHVIYFRHAQTERDYADQADPNMSLDDCETQRKLSDVGVQQSEGIGAAFTAKNIPVGDIITSQYCRAWKTAELAFGRYEQDPRLNFLPFEEYTDEQVEEMKTNVMPLLTAVPESGQNTVIVGHDDIFEAATGIYPDPQGIAYVLTPDGQGSFVLQANVLPQEWSEL